jgi:hypothetical protein
VRLCLCNSARRPFLDGHLDQVCVSSQPGLIGHVASETDLRFSMACRCRSSMFLREKYMV